MSRTVVTRSVVEIAIVVFSIKKGHYLLPSSNRSDAVFDNVVKSSQTNIFPVVIRR